MPNRERDVVCVVGVQAQYPQIVSIKLVLLDIAKKVKEGGLLRHCHQAIPIASN